MVTKRQIKKLKQQLNPGISDIDEMVIYFENENGTIETPEGRTITQEEYNKLPGVEINLKGAE